MLPVSIAPAGVSSAAIGCSSLEDNPDYGAHVLAGPPKSKNSGDSNNGIVEIEFGRPADASCLQDLFWRNERDVSK